ncbi:MAG: anhydro-N-acetylmuramic acid kinase [Alphaproteobacteria bacterium]
MTTYCVIGCMTGTSCDGLDLAYIETNGADILAFGPSETIPFPSEYSNLLRERINLRAPVHFMDSELSKTIADFHAKHIEEFMINNQLTVDAIGFHGQAVWHDPANQLTVQLGDCQHLANSTGIKVIGQVRQNDIKNGGQGAPLVPIYHLALASKLEKPTAFLNIGGVSNITFINADETLIAGDTGPGNALIDDWVIKHTGTPQDTDGQYAAQGIVNNGLLNKWLQHPFFDLPYPKSLDRMEFHQVLNDCGALSLEDGAATLTQFTVGAIMKGISLLPEQPNQLIVCGGGCHNPVLMSLLQKKFANVKKASEIGLNPDAIEAQLMGYLAARFFENLPSSFETTTGVEQPTIAGELFLPECI